MGAMTSHKIASTPGVCPRAPPSAPRENFVGEKLPFPADLTPVPTSNSPERSPVETTEAEKRVLAASEKRFRSLFDAAPLAVAITRGGVIIYGNPALTALVGVNDVVGRVANDFLAPAAREEIARHAQGRATGGFYSRPTTYEAAVLRADGERVPIRVEVAPIALPDGDAVISFAFDLSQERRARDEIGALLEREQRTSRFALRLQELSRALSAAATPDDVAAVGLESCLESSGAFAGIFVVPRDEDGATYLHLSQTRGYPPESSQGWERMNVEDKTPIAQAFRTEEPVWVGDVSEEEAIARFPVLRGAAASGSKALVALPLRLDGRVLGVMGLSFDAARDFDPVKRTFLETLAASCAQALERTRLDEASRELAQRQRESLALLNTLLDSAPVGFGLFDRAHRYVLVNAEMARINSLTVTAHLGRSTSDLFPTLGPTVEVMLEEVWQSGVPSHLQDFTEGTPDNPATFRHCTMGLYPVRVGGTDSGDMMGVGAILIEQTDRVRGQVERERLFAQLETERARFEAILQQMPSGVVIAEAPSGRLILGNDQVAQVWGHPYRSVQSTEEYSPAYRGFHLDGRPLEGHEWPLARAVQSGEVVRGEEFVIERGGGDLGVIRINAAPIRDSDGHITAAVAVFDNVTGRARAAEAQRLLAEVGSVLVAALDEDEIFNAVAQKCVPRFADWCIIAVPDADGLLQHVAIAHPQETAQADLAARLRELLQSDPQLPWNVSATLAAGRATLYPSGYLGAPDALPVSAAYRALIAEMDVQSAIVAPLAARERVVGVMLWLACNPKLPFDGDTLELAEELGRRLALTADNARLLQEAQIARDQAQQSLEEAEDARDLARRARDDAQAANRAKDEFLAVVSHELRTPLTPILGWLELLRSAEADEKLRTQAYDVIERNALAQAQLVNDILDVSRITTGKLRLELANISFDELVRRQVESLRTVWSDKRLAVEVEAQPETWVRGDAARLGQVVWNLLQNAIKFTPAGGHIRVVLAQENGQARLEVRDTGTGIDAELLSHLFERFRQGDSSSTRKTGGLGLGLSIVKHIVQLHGGHAGADSAGRGQGATVWVEIPLLAEGEAPDAPPLMEQLRPLEGRLKGVRLLVVDDEPDTREMLARLLEEAGANIRLAGTGKAALEIVAQFAPDALVSDIGMPDMDGLELRRELLARGFTLPAVALTAYASGEDQTRALEAGFERHLSKPVGALELVETVAGLLHKP